MTSLTTVEAQRRAELLDVDAYRIELDLTRGAQRFGSTTRVTFGCREPGAETFIELKDAHIERAELNGRPLDTSTYADDRLVLTGLLAHNELVIAAELDYQSTGEGMHRFVDPADGQSYVGAYCGVDVARQVFACFDQPDLKARLDISAIAPDEWTVVSNGLLDPARSGGGRWGFAATPPVATYLFVLLAGPWHTVRSTHAGLEFNWHCRASLADYLDRDADELHAISHACFDRYLELFDEPYPFDSYDQAFVPDHNWGALETPGCVTFRDEFLFRSAVTHTERQQRATVIAHEMAHMWFGDLVTMRWWDDLWLAESFAEYMGYRVAAEVTEFTGTWTEFAVSRKAWGYDADQRPSTHPIAPPRDAVGDTEAALTNFDGISYAKGASALRQLVAWIGDDAFLSGVNEFIADHRFASATLADLLEALARSSGRDVHAWAAQWLETAGVDRLTVDRGADGVVRVGRSGSRPHRLSLGRYRADDGRPGRLERLDRLDVDVIADSTAGGTADASTVVVPNDADLTFAKIRLDPTSWVAVTRSLGSFADPLTRAVLWTGARDLVRDAELDPFAYVDLVARHLPAERDPAIVRAVLQFLRDEIADHYVAPGQRAAVLDQLRVTCRELLDGDAGFDVALTATRSLVGSASGADARASLAADTLPGGVPFDADLRWRALLRSCVLGTAGSADIDAQLERDRSSLGREQARTCRAAIADSESKRATWASMFAGDDLSSRLLSATGRGFWWPEQVDLIGDFVPAFFPAAVTLAARRGPVIARVLSASAFPHHAVHESTLAVGELCLPAASTALRRGLTDRLDDVRRALRVRSQPSPRSRQTPRIW